MVGTFIVGSTEGDGVDCIVEDDTVEDETDVMEDNGEMQGVRL